MKFLLGSMNHNASGGLKLNKFVHIHNRIYIYIIISIYFGFSDNKIAEVSDEAKNDKIAKWLWAVSEKWTKLNYV